MGVRRCLEALPPDESYISQNNWYIASRLCARCEGRLSQNLVGVVYDNKGQYTVPLAYAVLMWGKMRGTYNYTTSASYKLRLFVPSDGVFQTSSLDTPCPVRPDWGHIQSVVIFPKERPSFSGLGHGVPRSTQLYFGILETVR